jgi:phage terminase Nu1 subunit (DNA packaging protein)
LKEKRNLADCKDLNEKQILKLYKIAHNTLWHWVNNGCPRHELRQGRKVFYRYYVEEINEWLEEDGKRRTQAIEEKRKASPKRDKYFIKHPLLGDEEGKK